MHFNKPQKELVYKKRPVHYHVTVTDLISIVGKILTSNKSIIVLNFLE